MSHPGIRLRISSPAGTLIQADSDHMHQVATFGTYSTSMHNFGCLPNCEEHGWTEMLKTTDGLTIEVLPVRLADELPDEPEDTNEETVSLGRRFRARLRLGSDRRRVAKEGP